MTPDSLSRQQLQIINKRTLRYPLDIAERDYYLTVALSLIADSPLAQMLVFSEDIFELLSGIRFSPILPAP
jgi:hypothetical protein